MTALCGKNRLCVQPIPTSLVAELIAYASQFSILSPGDVIITGTPGGVGARRTPPLFMKEGDVIEVEISNIATLRNPVISEAA